MSSFGEDTLFADLGKHEIFTPDQELSAAHTEGSGRCLSRLGSRSVGRNPDVLTCIANLSNDEVFTPPELANKMLDTLADAWARNNDGASIWADKTVTFLDPVSKSGVFLREITARLTEGLEERDPRPRRAGRSHPHQAGLRHRHHPSHQLALTPERLLLQGRQRTSLRRQVVRDEGGEHLVRAHGALMGGRQVSLLRSEPEDSRPRRRTSRPMPMRSFTPTTSKLASPSCLETTCSST